MHHLIGVERFCAGLAQNDLLLKFSYYFTFLFSGELFVCCYFASAALIFSRIIFNFPKDSRYDFYSKAFDFFAKLGFVFFVFVVVYGSIKIFSAVPRPNNINDLRSFPSAHSGLAAILAFHFYKYFSKFVIVILIMLLLINAFILLVLSCHSLIDIVFGTLFAPFTRILGIRIYNFCLPLVQFVKDLGYQLLFSKK